MVRRAFPAEVTNGQLRFQESLSDLEGRRVMVVLDECELPSKARPKLTPDALTAEEMPAEQDLDFERPFRRKTISATVIDGGRLRPCVILPEEIADE